MWPLSRQSQVSTSLAAKYKFRHMLKFLELLSIVRCRWTNMSPLWAKLATSTCGLFDTLGMLSLTTPPRASPARLSGLVSTTRTPYSSVPQRPTSLNSNGSRIRWCESSPANVVGPEQLRFSPLFTGCRSSGELTSKLRHSPINSSQPVNPQLRLNILPCSFTEINRCRHADWPMYKNSHRCARFRSEAPSVWNKLPVDIRNSTSLLTFRSRLKTHFFRLAFD